ncbi:MAG TPA: NUDIX domain-containing protein [Frankiaceae bacterium]|nr:NUDIX domain-containing protein [Frankiaceae bacterium]
MLARAAYRAVVVDHAYRLLLLHVTDGTASWWEPPGGEPLPGEDAAVAVARVLAEETGLTARVGPCVWVRRSRGLLRRVERFHVAWLDDPNAPRAHVAERDRVLGERRWTLDELATSDERFDPPALPALAPAVVRGEYGATPADV